MGINSVKLTKEGLLKIVKETIMELKNCGPGNPYRNQDGEFTAASADKGSWSLYRDEQKSSPCVSGQYKRSGANSKRSSTTRPCGRNEKHRCKDGSIKNMKEDSIVGKRDWNNIFNDYTSPRNSTSLTELGDCIIKELETVFNGIVMEDLERKCFTPGELQQLKNQTISGLWQGISNYERAKKGDN